MIHNVDQTYRNCYAGRQIDLVRHLEKKIQFRNAFENRRNRDLTAEEKNTQKRSRISDV